MPRVTDMITAAENVLGMGERGGDSNSNEITDWYGLIGAWCAMGDSFECSHGGGFSDDGDTCNLQDRYGIGPQTTRKGWAYCGYLREAFQNAGRWGVVPRVGAWFILNGDSHTGLVVGVGDGWIDTIEMNWGNACVRVRRGLGNIMGFCYLPYDGSPSNGPTDGHPMLQLGARGPAVVDLQNRLGVNGFTVAVDGDFGPGTDAAVRSFQSARGLESDGQVGPQTWEALGVAGTTPPPPPIPAPAPASNVPMFPGYTRRGSRGAAVRAVQQRMTDRGWDTGGVDGDFGPRTDAAIRGFQGEKGLDVDGLVGPITWTVMWTAPIT